MIAGGLATLMHRIIYSAKLLCAGWGFALGMMWMSLAGNISDGTDPDRASRVAGLYVLLTVVSMAISLAGLFLALSSKET